MNSPLLAILICCTAIGCSPKLMNELNKNPKQKERSILLFQQVDANALDSQMVRKVMDSLYQLLDSSQVLKTQNEAIGSDSLMQFANNTDSVYGVKEGEKYLLATNQATPNPSNTKGNGVVWYAGLLLFIGILGTVLLFPYVLLLAILQISFLAILLVLLGFIFIAMIGLSLIFKP